MYQTQASRTSRYPDSQFFRALGNRLNGLKAHCETLMQMYPGEDFSSKQLRNLSEKLLNLISDQEHDAFDEIAKLIDVDFETNELLRWSSYFLLATNNTNFLELIPTRYDVIEVRKGAHEVMALPLEWPTLTASEQQLYLNERVNNEHFELPWIVRFQQVCKVFSEQLRLLRQSEVTRDLINQLESCEYEVNSYLLVVHERLSQLSEIYSLKNLANRPVCLIFENFVGGYSLSGVLRSFFATNGLTTSDYELSDSYQSYFRKVVLECLNNDQTTLLFNQIIGSSCYRGDLVADEVSNLAISLSSNFMDQADSAVIQNWAEALKFDYNSVLNASALLLHRELLVNNASRASTFLAMVSAFNQQNPQTFCDSANQFFQSSPTQLKSPGAITSEYEANKLPQLGYHNTHLFHTVGRGQNWQQYKVSSKYIRRQFLSANPITSESFVLDNVAYEISPGSRQLFANAVQFYLSNPFSKPKGIALYKRVFDKAKHEYSLELSPDSKSILDLIPASDQEAFQIYLELLSASEDHFAVLNNLKTQLQDKSELALTHSSLASVDDFTLGKVLTYVRSTEFDEYQGFVLKATHYPLVTSDTHAKLSVALGNEIKELQFVQGAGIFPIRSHLNQNIQSFQQIYKDKSGTQKKNAQGMSLAYAGVVIKPAFDYYAVPQPQEAELQALTPVINVYAEGVATGLSIAEIIKWVDESLNRELLTIDELRSPECQDLDICQLALDIVRSPGFLSSRVNVCTAMDANHMAQAFRRIVASQKSLDLICPDNDCTKATLKAFKAQYKKQERFGGSSFYAVINEANLPYWYEAVQTAHRLYFGTEDIPNSGYKTVSTTDFNVGMYRMTEVLSNMCGQSALFSDLSAHPNVALLPISPGMLTSHAAFSSDWNDYHNALLFRESNPEGLLSNLPDEIKTKVDDILSAIFKFEGTVSALDSETFKQTREMTKRLQEIKAETPKFLRVNPDRPESVAAELTLKLYRLAFQVAYIGIQRYSELCLSRCGSQLYRQQEPHDQLTPRRR